MLPGNSLDQSMSKHEMMYLNGNGTVHIIREVNLLITITISVI
jgi:hypothetical protein